MSTASSHSPTELKEGKEGSVQLLSAREMDELRVLTETHREDREEGKDSINHKERPIKERGKEK